MFKGDQKGNFTYVGSQGCSVIDIVLCNYKALCNAVDFEILEVIVNSGHKIAALKCICDYIENYKANHLTDKNENSKLCVKWKKNLKGKFMESMKWSPNVGLVDLDVNGLANNLTDTIVDVAKKN